MVRPCKPYMSSTTTADAPPPPLHTPATPKWPFFSFRTPSSVTRIRAPLQPRGCPRETAPPWAFTDSCLHTIISGLIINLLRLLPKLGKTYKHTLHINLRWWDCWIFSICYKANDNHVHEHLIELVTVWLVDTDNNKCDSHTHYWCKAYRFQFQYLLICHWDHLQNRTRDSIK